jgi:hypothetical protein
VSVQKTRLPTQPTSAPKSIAQKMNTLSPVLVQQDTRTDNSSEQRACASP